MMNATTGRGYHSGLDPFAEILAQAESIAPHPTLSGRRRPAIPAFDDILSQAPDFDGSEQSPRAVTLAPARIQRASPQVVSEKRPAAVTPERVADPRPLPPVVKVDPARKALAPGEVLDQAAPLTAAQEELIRALDEFDYDE